MSAKTIIQKLGGVRKAARVLGVPRGTVSDWNVADRIPAHRQVEVMRRARSHGVPLSPADFFPASELTGQDDSSSVNPHTERVDHTVIHASE